MDTHKLLGHTCTHHYLIMPAFTIS